MIDTICETTDGKLRVKFRCRGNEKQSHPSYSDSACNRIPLANTAEMCYGDCKGTVGLFFKEGFPARASKNSGESDLRTLKSSSRKTSQGELVDRA
jgi:hypothetical protein